MATDDRDKLRGSTASHRGVPRAIDEDPTPIEGIRADAPDHLRRVTMHDLNQLGAKVDEAIKIDKDDHAELKETIREIREDQRSVNRQVNTISVDFAKVGTNVEILVEDSKLLKRATFKLGTAQGVALIADQTDKVKAKRSLRYKIIRGVIGLLLTLATAGGTLLVERLASH